MSIHAPLSVRQVKPFGRWLLAQHDRDDAVGMLADAARRDPQFPADGDVQRISARLNAIGADPDMHMALEDAELDWSAY